MKKLITIILFLLSLESSMSAQEIAPQFGFYMKNKPWVTKQFDNDAERYLYLKSLSDQYLLNKYTQLNILYQKYLFEAESAISYSTIDDMKYPFRSKDFVNGLRINFGAPLIANEDNLMFNHGSSSTSFMLLFDGPVKQIDPALFNINVKSIQLPLTPDLAYKSSPEIRVDNLSSIEGNDIINHHSLVSKDNTLIVAALAFMDTYMIPEKVQSIGAGALRGAKANAIIVPERVSNIGEKAFDLSNINKFFFLPTTPPELGDCVFGDDLKKDFTIYVPKKQIKLYKRAYPNLSSHFKSTEKDKGTFLYIQAQNENQLGNKVEAFNLLKQAAKYDNADALFDLGWYYDIMNEKDKAIKCYKKAAKHGHVEAIEYSCMYYMFDITPPDVKSAAKWTKRLIITDYTKAYLLGELYTEYTDFGLPYDLKKAKKAYQEAYQLYIDNKDTSLANEISGRIDTIDYLISKKADKKIKFKCNEENFNGDPLEWELFNSFKDQEFYLLDLEQKMYEYLSDVINEDEAFDLTWKVVMNWKQSGYVSIK